MFSLRKLLAAMACSMMMVSSAHAEAAKADAAASETDPVLIFNRVCYAAVPVVEKIENTASRLAWPQLGGEDLKRFTPLEDPAYLKGWDIKLAERLYRLGLVQSEPSENMKGNFPEFAEGQATACTLILDGDDEWKTVKPRMNALIGKEPGSTDVADGELLTTTWSGGNEDFKVFVFAKSTKEGKATLLNVTILAKEKV